MNRMIITTIHKTMKTMKTMKTIVAGLIVSLLCSLSLQAGAKEYENAFFIIEYNSSWELVQVSEYQFKLSYEAGNDYGGLDLNVIQTEEDVDMAGVAEETIASMIELMPGLSVENNQPGTFQDYQTREITYSADLAGVEVVLQHVFFKLPETDYMVILTILYSADAEDVKDDIDDMLDDLEVKENPTVEAYDEYSEYYKRDTDEDEMTISNDYLSIIYPDDWEAEQDDMEGNILLVYEDNKGEDAAAVDLRYVKALGAEYAFEDYSASIIENVKSSIPDINVLDEGEVKFQDYEAYSIKYTGKYSGIDMALENILFHDKKSGIIGVITITKTIGYHGADDMIEEMLETLIVIEN